MKNSAILVLLLANILLVCALIFKNDVKAVETIKVGGKENYSELQMLYKSDIYKKQQTEAIAQFEAQLVQLANPVASTGDSDETFVDR